MLWKPASCGKAVKTPTFDGNSKMRKNEASHLKHNNML
jgi:hypothetical protein